MMLVYLSVPCRIIKLATDLSTFMRGVGAGLTGLSEVGSGLQVAHIARGSRAHVACSTLAHSLMS